MVVFWEDYRMLVVIKRQVLEKLLEPVLMTLPLV